MLVETLKATSQPQSPWKIGRETPQKGTSERIPVASIFRAKLLVSGRVNIYRELEDEG